MEQHTNSKNPTLHRYLFTVTPFSKYLAMILFIILPFIGFYLGMKYQEKVTISTPVVLEVKKTITPTPIIGTTTGFKLYSNKNYHFSFEYPSYLTKLEDKLPKIPTGRAVDKLRLSSKDDKYNFSLYINPRFGGTCSPTWIYEAKRNGSGIEFTKTMGSPNWLEGCTSTFFIAYDIKISDKDIIYIIFAYDKDNADAQSDFEKILSSFKFTQ